MSASVLFQLNAATRPHRQRLWLRSVLRAALPAWWGGTAGLLIVCVVAQLWMLPARSWWAGLLVLTTCMAWGVLWRWHQRHARAVWQQLDRSYGWQHSVSTVVSFAAHHADTPLAAAQYTRTMALIATTPHTMLPIWERRMGWSLLGWCVALLCLLLVPTPFDVQLTAQARVQYLAETSAQQIAELPPIHAQLDAQRIADELRVQRDAQSLVAQLDVTMHQIATARQQAQQLATYAAALAQSPNPQDSGALMREAAETLSPDQYAALQSAQQRANAGDATAYTQLQAEAQRQRQAADAWQSAMSAAKQQAVALAPAAASIPQDAAADTEINTTAHTPAANGTAARPDSAAGSAMPPNPGGSGNGSGSTPASSSTLQLFVPQLDAQTTITIQSPTGNPSGDPTFTSGGGLDTPALQYTYADVVTQATQRATQAITDAQIPWTAQQTVHDYFAVLQESTP